MRHFICGCALLLSSRTICSSCITVWKTMKFSWCSNQYALSKKTYIFINTQILSNFFTSVKFGDKFIICFECFIYPFERILITITHRPLVLRLVKWIIKIQKIYRSIFILFLKMTYIPKN